MAIYSHRRMRLVIILSLPADHAGACLAQRVLPSATHGMHFHYRATSPPPDHAAHPGRAGMHMRGRRADRRRPVQMCCAPFGSQPPLGAPSQISLRNLRKLDCDGVLTGSCQRRSAPIKPRAALTNARHCALRATASSSHTGRNAVGRFPRRPGSAVDDTTPHPIPALAGIRMNSAQIGQARLAMRRILLRQQASPVDALVGQDEMGILSFRN